MSEAAKEWKLEPTVMWRMSRPGGQTAHALIDPRERHATVVWFVNGRPLGQRVFADWSDALDWTELLQTQNWVAGWRVEGD